MMKKPKMNRRTFLAAGLGLTLGGCASSGAGRFPGSEGITNKLKTNDLSNPPGQMTTDYDAIVIGSGYGASVIAARLASRTKKLCVLERGREWQPGEFPTSAMALASAVRQPGRPLGLIDISGPIGSDVDIVCGNGLGGTSLINAAIAIRPLPNVFGTSEWPAEIQEAAKDGSLDHYYRLAESVLKPASIIQNKNHAKSMTHQKTTLEMRRKYGELRLNIRPENYPGGLNEYGVSQGPCIQCGDCCGGCNFGAKNTLTTNYLAMAKKNGAEIYTRCEVTSIEKGKNGYVIHFMYHGSNGTRALKVRAKRVFLGAGSKGSTELLLRSQNDDFLFSTTLGSRLSANGDVLGMAYNTNSKTNILAMGSDSSLLNDGNRPGPIIASYADYREPSMANDVNSQFLLLDGVVPSSLRDILALAMAGYAQKNRDKFSSEQIRRLNLDLKGTATDDGALNYSMLYFACGHDSSGGRYEYSKSLREIIYKWPGVTRESTFQRINGVMSEFSNRLGGLFIPNPRSTLFGGRIQATHPLGGCPMGRDARSGVVDHLGRVFNDKGGFHPDLYVVDAAIIPRSLAATPLLTITALAERIADKIAIS